MRLRRLDRDMVVMQSELAGVLSGVVFWIEWCRETEEELDRDTMFEGEAGLKFIWTYFLLLFQAQLRRLGSCSHSG